MLNALFRKYGSLRTPLLILMVLLCVWAPLHAVAQIATPSDQVAVLEKQVEVLQQYRRDQLTALWSALGFSAAVLVAFLALVGFFTHRRLQDDREAVLAHLAAEVSKVKGELVEVIAQSRASLGEEHQKKLSELQEAQSRVAKSVAHSVIAPLEKRLEQLRHEILVLRRDQLKKTAEEAETGEKHSQALTIYFHLASVSKELGWDWAVAEALNKVKILLLEKGAQFDAIELDEVMRFLKSLPDTLEPLGKAIAGAMVNLR